MQRICVGNLLCDPPALQAEGSAVQWKPRQGCQLTFPCCQGSLGPSAQAKQAQCIYWYMPGCTRMLFTVSKMGPATMAHFARPVLSLEVVNIAVFLGVRKMRKQCRIARKPGSCFNPSAALQCLPLATEMSLCSCLAWLSPWTCIGSCWEPDTKALTTVHNSAAALQESHSKLGSSLQIIGNSIKV